MLRSGGACAHLGDRVSERSFGAEQERARSLGHLAHREARAAVRPIAVELGRHVDVHQISFTQHALRRDAMRDLVVDADAGGTRKSIGKLRCRTRAVPPKHVAPQLVELCGRHTGRDLGGHRVARLRHHRTHALQRDHILLTVDRHAPQRTLERAARQREKRVQ